MRRFKNKLMITLVYLAAALSIGVVVAIVGYIFVRGVGHLSLELFTAPAKTTQNTGLLPLIATTLAMVATTLAISAPIGIFAAIYIEEYAKNGSRAVEIIGVATETLSGIPSIIYGLFGLLFFVKGLNMSFSLLAGCLTLAIMVLPTIIRATGEALKSVPITYREASLALGATQLGTIFRIVLPAALPGILASLILSIGRIVGETAAVMLTAGTVLGFPKGLSSSGRTLSVQMYILAKEGLGDLGLPFATALVLIVIVLVINFAARALFRSRLEE